MKTAKKRNTLTVITFEEWKAAQPKPEKKDCECCQGVGYVELHDDFDNDYDCECKECDGYGKAYGYEPTKREWIRAVRSDARKYRKFTGEICKLTIKGNG